jgi:hypothetical protein
MIFRGLICLNDNDFNAKNEALTNAIRLIKDEENNFLFPSVVYSGRNGKADIYTSEDKPILVEPTNELILAEAMKLPLNFVDLDSSIIKQEEI